MVFNANVITGLQPNAITQTAQPAAQTAPQPAANNLIQTAQTVPLQGGLQQGNILQMVTMMMEMIMSIFGGLMGNAGGINQQHQANLAGPALGASVPQQAPVPQQAALPPQQPAAAGANQGTDSLQAMLQQFLSAMQGMFGQQQQAPAPAPTTATNPAPAPQQAPAAQPAPTTATNPAPAPQQAPAAQPAPAPAPTTATNPAPAPQAQAPFPLGIIAAPPPYPTAPKPAPAPAPVPYPPAPAPAPLPAPVPKPIPKPVPTPVPVPVPVPVPIPVPIPIPVPYPPGPGPVPPAPVPNPPAPPPAPQPVPPPGHENKVWGDPHFEGLFHGVKETEATGDLNGNGKIGDTVSQKYDFQGKAGQTINVLSDSGVQVNGELGAWGKKGATVFKDIGIQVRGEDGQTYGVQYAVGKNPPSITRPGQEPVAMVAGETVQLGGANQTATWDGKNDVSVKANEYNLSIKQQSGGYLNLHTSTTENYDGLNNDGVLGISGNIEAIGGKVQNGREGAGANGEGVATTDGKGNGADRKPDDYLVNDGVLGQNTKHNSFNTATA